MPKVSQLSPVTPLTDDTGLYAYKGGTSGRTSLGAVKDYISAEFEATVEDISDGVVDRRVAYLPRAVNTTLFTPNDKMARVIDVRDFAPYGATVDSIDWGIAISAAFAESVRRNADYGRPDITECADPVRLIDFGLNILTPVTVPRAAVLIGGGRNTTLMAFRGYTSSVAPFVSPQAFWFHNLQFELNELPANTVACVDITAGNVFRSNSVSFGSIRKCPAIRCAGDYQGINTAFASGAFHPPDPGIACVEVLTTGRAEFNNCQFLGNGGTQGGETSGVRITGTRRVMFSGWTNFDGLKHGVEVIPASGNTVRSVLVAGKLNASSLTGNLVHVAPTGGNIWKMDLGDIGLTDGGGSTLFLGGTGQVGATVVGTLTSENGAAPGAVIRQSNVTIRSAVVAANASDGIVIGGGATPVSNVQILGGTLGTTGTQWGANAGYGVNITAQAHDKIKITGVDFPGNTLGSINDLSTGLRKRYEYTDATMYPVSVGAAFMRPLAATPRVAFLGDSITGASGISNLQYAAWTRVLSRGRIITDNSFVQGVGGDTSAQALARLPNVIAVNPDIVVVLLGANDEAGGITLNGSISNLTAIYTRLISMGIRVIAIPPLFRSTASPNVRLAAIGSWLNDYSRRTPGLYMVTGVADNFLTPSTGLPLANMLQDGLHPTPAGAYVIGNQIQQLISKLTSDQDFPNLFTANDVYGSSTNPRGNLLVNPQFAGTGGTLPTVVGLSGQVPSNWIISGGGDSSSTGTLVYSKTAPATGLGDWSVATLTNRTSGAAIDGATLYQEIPFSSGKYAAGDAIQFTAEFECAGPISEFYNLGGVSISEYDGSTSDSFGIMNTANAFLTTTSPHTAIMQTDPYIIRTPVDTGSAYVRARMQFTFRGTTGANAIIRWRRPQLRKVI